MLGDDKVSTASTRRSGERTPAETPNASAPFPALEFVGADALATVDVASDSRTPYVSVAAG
jgi:hypothetical protein